MARLDEIWDECLYIAEEYNPNSDEWHDAVDKAEQMDIQLRSTLTEEQGKILDKLITAIGNMHNIEHKEAFKYGFALAVELLTEAKEITDKKKCN